MTLTAEQCFSNAARVLEHAEAETDSRLFEHYTSLAEHWIELGTSVREGSSV